MITSEITCPNCGFKKIEEVPANSCQFFYECENCKTLLKPVGKDCCVYCSYGTINCPSNKEHKSCNSNCDC